MDVKDLRVGYAPYDLTLNRPGDRRRFLYYANSRGLKFEIAQPSEKYDVVIVSAGADLTEWGAYKHDAILIYDYVDSYLEAADLKSIFRGAAKFAVRQNRYLYLNYNRAIEDLCRRASAVICSTPAQQQRVADLCPINEVILDFHFGVTRNVKHDYAVGPVFNIVWEGLGGNFQYMRLLAPVLQRVARRHRIAVHAVTDLAYGAFLAGRIWKKTALAEARHIFWPTYLYSWNEQTASAVITSCDLAVIPVPLDNPMAAAKPPNKLLLLWRMGMPVIASATDAYAHAMGEAGISMTCATDNEWEQGFLQFITDENCRRRAGNLGRAYVQRAYAENRVLDQWDAILSRAIGRASPRFA